MNRRGDAYVFAAADVVFVIRFSFGIAFFDNIWLLKCAEKRKNSFENYCVSCI